MYICVCKAVSESRLRKAVEGGEVISLRDLTRELGVGTCCGKCVPAAKQALSTALGGLAGRSSMLPSQSIAGGHQVALAG